MAVLIDNPQHAVISMLARETFMKESLNLNTEIFSTETAALHWIQVV